MLRSSRLMVVKQSVLSLGDDDCEGSVRFSSAAGVVDILTALYALGFWAAVATVGSRRQCRRRRRRCRRRTKKLLVEEGSDRRLRRRLCRRQDRRFAGPSRDRRARSRWTRRWRHRRAAWRRRTSRQSGWRGRHLSKSDPCWRLQNEATLNNLAEKKSAELQTEHSFRCLTEKNIWTSTFWKSDFLEGFLHKSLNIFEALIRVLVFRTH